MSRSEAQDFHMRLNSSKKEVLRLGNLNLEAEKREKADYKRLEHLGGTEAELLKMRKLYMESSDDLRLLVSRNKNLRDQNAARKPLPHQVAVKSLLKAFPKLHLVGVEDRINGALALAKDILQGAVVTVFQSIYQAMEPTYALVAKRWTTGDEQVESANYLFYC